MEDKLSPEQSTPELTPGAKAPDGGKTDSSGLTPGMVATPDFTCDTILEVMNKPKKGILFYEGERDVMSVVVAYGKSNR
jgi:hypothetical protein